MKHRRQAEPFKKEVVQNIDKKSRTTNGEEHFIFTCELSQKCLKQMSCKTTKFDLCIQSFICKTIDLFEEFGTKNCSKVMARDGLISPTIKL